MKIIITGAGVSGLAAAADLVARGHEVEVYERAPELRAGGNGVLIWHNATGILRDLGLPLERLGRRMDTADVWSSRGEPLMRTDLTRIAAVLGTPCIAAMRGDVLRLLADAVPEGVIRLGKECAEIVERPGGVTVRFTDGTTADGDVLIGADGYRSAVRTHLFGADDARYTGLASWHGTTTEPLDLGGDHCVPTFYGRQGLCTLHPVGDGRIHWSFEVPFDNGRRRVPPPGTALSEASRSEGRRLASSREWFGGWAPPVSDLLDVLKEEDIAEAPHTLHDVRKWWGRGPITLVGDAAHAIPPRAGWGVNQALEDSWVLGHALDGPGSPADRLRSYEQARRGRARTVRGRAKMLRHSNRLLLALRLTRDGLQSTKMLQANIQSSSSYLNRDLPPGTARPAAEAV